jgi:hypothetical protein
MVRGISTSGQIDGCDVLKLVRQTSLTKEYATSRHFKVMTASANTACKICGQIFMASNS